MTPDDWNDLVEDTMEEVVEEWEKEGVGVNCGDVGRLTHLVWADNIWIFGRSWEELARMQERLTESMEAKGLWWKESSLMVMQTDGSHGDMVTEGKRGAWVHKEVDRMVVVGVLLDNQGSTAASMEHREGIAQNIFLLCRNP